MVPLQRLPEPALLTEKRAAWTQRFLERRAQNPRPPSSQYAHAEIVAALAAMSHWKCFYCERSLKDQGHEVDHYIEVAERPEEAFTWANLYLACGGCNDKLTNVNAPAVECLDPCAPDCAPAEHLTFDDECIRSRAGSARGARTIKKYKLDRPQQDYLRVRQLKHFLKAHQVITERCRAAGGRSPTADELELLRGFADPSQPFSLMFTVYLRGAGLLP